MYGVGDMLLRRCCRVAVPLALADAWPTATGDDDAAAAAMQDVWVAADCRVACEAQRTRAPNATGGQQRNNTMTPSLLHSGGSLDGVGKHHELQLSEADHQAAAARYLPAGS
ncbi:hypothetical protein THAOC_28195 [Thalassiosira oceanica]|uniref:Uncharacterized protein n=1 Tax=Thalassiosira oceanica TaxID=159749 RepID=K0RUG5_THAOC|nr:hypothetical protein THAOC_28195 [Thalassiosira oceanica]|eukprot:EJK52516.1 hypothetical protein THAOC_28195 [Thalassiosira oceanica]